MFILIEYEEKDLCTGSCRDAGNPGRSGTGDESCRFGEICHVMTHAYSNAFIDKVEEALKNGLGGNDNDDW